MPSEEAVAATGLRGPAPWLALGVVGHAIWLAFGLGGGRATDVASDLFQVAILGAATAWTFTSARRGGAQALAWGLLAAGLALWTLATGHWSYYEIVEETVLPVPSLADIGWLAYPAFATAAFLVAALRGRSAAQLAVASLDTALTAVGIFLVAWVVLLEDVWTAASGSLTQRVLALAYPMGDIAVVTAALGLAFRLHPKDRRRLWAIPAGAAIVAFGNLNLSWSYLHAGFQTGSVSDICWTGGVALMAFGVSRAARAALRPVSVFATRYEQGLPYFVAVAAMGFLVMHYVRTGDLGDVEEAVALTWITTFLVRQFLFLRHAVDVQARLGQAQASAGLGSWEWTPRGIRLSPMADALLTGAPGPSDDKVVSPQVAFKALPAEAQADVGRDLDLLLRSGTAFERRIAGPPHGVQRHLRVRGDGSPPRGTIQDVTREVEDEQRRQREEAATQEVARLSEMNQLKTQFINMAAHELSTPLTPIKLTLASLRAPVRGDREEVDRQRQELLGLLQRNVDRLANLLKDILDAARVQSSRLELRTRPVALGQAARDVVQELGPSFAGAGLHAEVEADAEPVIVEADPGRLHEVLVNLLNNAIKFTPSGGKVVVHVRAGREAGQVEVADTGVGIAAGDLDRLFQPFSQVGDKTVKTQQGTGLGLYLARGIVEQHGGRIWAASPGLGKGSTFGLEIPLHKG